LYRHLSSLAHFLHARLLLLLLAVYVLAAFVPGPGLALRKISIAIPGAGPSFALPALMLSLLLFHAGLGARFSAMRQIRQSAVLMGAGTLVNLVAPFIAILAVHFCLRFWHSPAQFQNIITGMVLVGSMPIAGSSTAWAQNAKGDLTVSLGLVLLSTALSPLTTPLLLRAGSWMTAGAWSHRLHDLATQGTGGFLLGYVLVPAIAGILVRFLLGDGRVQRIQPAVKIVNTAVLVLLCYMNAAVSLPRIVARPDLDFLAVVLLVTVFLCVVMFGAGWLLARFLRLDPARKAPLIFGLGMNNNGTGGCRRSARGLSPGALTDPALQPGAAPRCRPCGPAAVPPRRLESDLKHSRGANFRYHAKPTPVSFLRNSPDAQSG
jgi:BASS family bile acid:Na+ symporter